LHRSARPGWSRGRQYHDHGLLRAPRREIRRDGDGRTRIAPHRLQPDLGLRADSAKLVGDEEAVIDVGDHDRPFESRIVQHLHRRLKGRTLADQWNELLGQRLA
jgi:hypothetical protein